MSDQHEERSGLTVGQPVHGPSGLPGKVVASWVVDPHWIWGVEPSRVTEIQVDEDGSLERVVEFEGDTHALVVPL